MEFSENLKVIRKEKNLSQEDLADLLNVSRQAVSKWEQGIGYPETEKLFLLAKELNISLDWLMGVAEKEIQPQFSVNNQNDKIMIQSADSMTLVSCYKVVAFPLSNALFKCKPDEPQFILYGIDANNILGENRVILGYYPDEEAITKEQNEIMKAIEHNKTSYTLKYYVNVKKSLLSIKQLFKID